MSDPQTVTLSQIESHLWEPLSIPLYVKRQTVTGDGTEPATLPAAWAQWQANGRAFWQQMNSLVETLDGLDRV